MSNSSVTAVSVSDKSGAAMDVQTVLMAAMKLAVVSILTRIFTIDTCTYN